MSQPTLIAAEIAGSLTLAEAAQVSPAGIVSRTVLQAPELRVVLFGFDAGQELTAHTSRRRAVVQVLSGACEFQFNGTWQRLETGALLHLPPNHPHAVRASAGAFTMLLTLGADASSAPAPTSSS